MSDEQRALRNEYARIRWDAKARAAGKRKRQRHPELPSERTYLEVGPLVRMLDARADELDDISAMSGVGPRIIYMLRYHNEYVTLDVADKLCVAMGTQLELVYRGARTRDSFEVSID
jgi:hypothetical protein